MEIHFLKEGDVKVVCGQEVLDPSQIVQYDGFAFRFYFGTAVHDEILVSAECSISHVPGGDPQTVTDGGAGRPGAGDCHGLDIIGQIFSGADENEQTTGENENGRHDIDDDIANGNFLFCCVVHGSPPVML